MTPTTAPTSAAAPTRSAGANAAPVLIALDIDGTLTDSGSVDVPAPTTAAVAEALEAGHHVVLASGRSLAGVLPIAHALGLVDGWAIASNGAVIAGLTPTGYALELSDVREVDARQVVTAALNARLPGLAIAVEEVGTGYYVSEPFPGGVLRGEQTVLPVHELGAVTTPRIVLRAPSVHTLIEPVRAAGLTATPGADVDLIDVTRGGVSKATALDTVRRRLRIERRDTVAVGDGENDLEALAWAAWGVAMGHASTKVRAAADHVTGTLAQHGAATVLTMLAALSADDARGRPIEAANRADGPTPSPRRTEHDPHPTPGVARPLTRENPHHVRRYA
jgi:HAD superfamily hydrolase (TIGR01484 family)